MLWDIINHLKSNTLRERSRELRAKLAGISDFGLIKFHCEAISAYKDLFNQHLRILYSAVFEGETNGSGLTDFCSNIILSGQRLYEAVLLNSDSFADTAMVEGFNDDSGLSVTGVARQLLIERHGGSADEMLAAAGAKSLDGIWKDLEVHVGRCTFEVDWTVVARLMPHIYTRFYRND